ncbi:Spy/CpxP family protein refolding chaperone [Roseiarcus fermentans]|uniref:Spy/CpxP family protein refolding chaperone n=1 Tax=Roseiarcus fermentans TaxID=1473586 RepID=A0A366ETP6_9HYPH|nr:periplasmic heavy metal sensor [Roseiarcus fermentans]RBP05768.1 Spy/CpxP family protein refolding chaperone [Roseiarcus fermentans]
MITDNTANQPQGLAQTPTGRRGRRWLRPAALAGVLVGGVALAAGGYAAYAATAGADGAGWRDGMRLAFAQRAIAHALDSVGASSAQEAKIHDIVAARFAELGPDPDERAAMRKQALALLAAPTIDRAAVETMRLDAVAKFDAKSKAIVAGLLDIADQLTPDQRAKLAAHAEEMAERGPMGGPMGGPWGHWGHWGHGPMMDGPHGGPDDGPGHGPDGGPDKD